VRPFILKPVALTHNLLPPSATAAAAPPPLPVSNVSSRKALLPSRSDGEALETGSNDVNVVKRRVQVIVSGKPFIHLSLLPKLYKDTFSGECLDYKSLGFRKLMNLVQSIDAIQMKQDGRNWLLSSSSEDSASSEPVASGTDGEVTTKATFILDNAGQSQDAPKETAVLSNQGNLPGSTVPLSDGTTCQGVRKRVQAQEQKEGQVKKTASFQEQEAKLAALQHENAALRDKLAKNTH